MNFCKDCGTLLVKEFSDELVLKCNVCNSTFPASDDDYLLKKVIKTTDDSGKYTDVASRIMYDATCYTIKESCTVCGYPIMKLTRFGEDEICYLICDICGTITENAKN